jgi:hypothetical protein
MMQRPGVVWQTDALLFVAKVSFDLHAERAGIFINVGLSTDPSPKKIVQQREYSYKSEILGSNSIGPYLNRPKNTSAGVMDGFQL